MTDSEKQVQLAAELAAATTKITEVESKLAAKDAEIVKKDGIVQAAETKFNEMAGETGENRKAATEAMRALLAVQKERDAEREAAKILRDELAEMKKVLGPLEADRANRKSQESETAEEIEAGLSDAEQATLDEAWKGADEATQKRIKADSDFRKQFLVKAKAATHVAAESDLSDWRNKPADKSPSPSGEGLDELFKTAKQRAEAYPDGSRAGQQRSGGRKEPKSSRPPQAVVKKKWGIQD